MPSKFEINHKKLNWPSATNKAMYLVPFVSMPEWAGCLKLLIEVNK
jgi:hypothetical protein